MHCRINIILLTRVSYSIVKRQCYEVNQVLLKTNTMHMYSTEKIKFSRYILQSNNKATPFLLHCEP